MFKKKEGKPKISPVVDRAKAISEKYRMMESCCSILSGISYEDDHYRYLYTIHTGGWRINRYQIEQAGIDINKIYDFIKELAEKRKLEIEHELAILNT